jgi:hypothetical protein
VEAPIRCDPPLTPSSNCGDRGSQDENPHRKVEESVRECVHFQPGERIGGIFFGVAQHVMPLEYLVENDTVNESA